jgi:molecular chaperone DnaK
LLLITQFPGVVEVLSSHGNTHLGGDHFDLLLLDLVCEDFLRQHGVDLRLSTSAKSRVLRAVEEAKKRLSAEPVAQIEEEFIAEKGSAPLHLRRELQRAQYEELIGPLLIKTLNCVDGSLSDAKLNANQIDKVVLVVGASRTPFVHRLLTEQLGQPVLHARRLYSLCPEPSATRLLAVCHLLHGNWLAAATLARAVHCLP